MGRSLLDRVQDAGPQWLVLGLAALALLAVPVLRRLLPRGRRHRGRGAILFFAVLDYDEFHNLRGRFDILGLGSMFRFQQ